MSYIMELIGMYNDKFKSKINADIEIFNGNICCRVNDL